MSKTQLTFSINQNHHLGSTTINYVIDTKKLNLTRQEYTAMMEGVASSLTKLRSYETELGKLVQFIISVCDTTYENTPKTKGCESMDINAMNSYWSTNVNSYLSTNVNSNWSTNVNSFNSSKEFGNAHRKAYDQGNEDRNWNGDHKYGFGLPPEGGVIFGFDGNGDPKVLPRPKRRVPMAWSEEYRTLSIYWKGQWCVWGASDQSLASGCSVE